MSKRVIDQDDLVRDSGYKIPLGAFEDSVSSYNLKAHSQARDPHLCNLLKFWQIVTRARKVHVNSTDSFVYRSGSKTHLAYGT